MDGYELERRIHSMGLGREDFAILLNMAEATLRQQSRGHLPVRGFVRRFVLLCEAHPECLEWWKDASIVDVNRETS